MFSPLLGRSLGQYIQQITPSSGWTPPPGYIASQVAGGTIYRPPQGGQAIFVSGQTGGGPAVFEKPPSAGVVAAKMEVASPVYVPEAGTPPSDGTGAPALDVGKGEAATGVAGESKMPSWLWIAIIGGGILLISR